MVWSIFALLGVRGLHLIFCNETRTSRAQGIERDKWSKICRVTTPKLASSLFCHHAFSPKQRGRKKTTFVSAHYISAVIFPNESSVCGLFQQRMVTDLVNWTWLSSPWSPIVCMTDCGLLGQNCTILMETHWAQRVQTIYTLNNDLFRVWMLTGMFES